MANSERRQWIKIFGKALGLTFFAELFGLTKKAEAASWSKVGTAVGTAGTWQKINNKSARTVAITSEFTQGYALKADGFIYDTGGTNSFFQRRTFVTNVIAIDGSIAIVANGTVFQNGALRTDLANIVSISASISHSLALDAQGNVWSTGYNGQGQLGINSTTTQTSYIQATGISNAIAVSAGNQHSLALRSDGYIYASGDNFFGKLGISVAGGSRRTFVQCVGVSNAVAIAASGSFSVALTADGFVYGAGSGSGKYGVLASSASVFTQATGISNAIAISTGRGSADSNTIALRSDGFVFATGDNSSGILGDNSTTAVSTFIQATGVSNVMAIACGSTYALALRSDGIVFGCGANQTGQLGDNSTTDRSTYVQALDF